MKKLTKEYICLEVMVTVTKIYILGSNGNSECP